MVGDPAERAPGILAAAGVQLDPREPEKIGDWQHIGAALVRAR